MSDAQLQSCSSTGTVSTGNLSSGQTVYADVAGKSGGTQYIGYHDGVNS